MDENQFKQLHATLRSIVGGLGCLVAIGAMMLLIGFFVALKMLAQ